jgi:hypothetical protein
LAWEIENVFAMYWVGLGQLHYPFPCDELAVFQTRTPPLAPSVYRRRSENDAALRWAVQPQSYTMIFMNPCLASEDWLTCCQLHPAHPS